MSAAAPASRHWLWGPLPDVLLGCGGLYLLAFVVLAAGGNEMRLAQPTALAPLMLLFLSMPHYAATLLRVYESREDRAHYRRHATGSTLIVFALFVAGLHVPLVGVALLTVYLTWSPWHYTGQNYGLALMFLGRRGISIPAATKRWIYASFVLSYGLAFLVMHEAFAGAADNSVSYLPSYSGQGARVAFYPLGIPEAVNQVLVPLVAVAYLVALGVAAFRLRKLAAWSSLAPTLLLTTTQALWFSIPFLSRYTGNSLGFVPLDWDHRIHFFLFIAAGHSIQYLWVSSYYAKRTPTWHGVPHYLFKTLAVGAALWTLPLVVFAPWALGSLSYDAGLFLVLSAGINIHHFILDGAIWKLRDRKVGATLIGGASTEEARAEGGGGLRVAVWSVIGVGLALGLLFHVDQLAFEARLRAGRYASAAGSLDRFAWFGAESPQMRARLAQGFLQEGDTDGALEQLERSAALAPTPKVYVEIGKIQAGRGAWEPAADSYEAAAELAPRQPGLRYEAGRARLEQGDVVRAIEHFERALALDASHAASQRGLREARARQGDGQAS